jgi:uncharacterized protein
VIADSHCHFFSSRFLEVLSASMVDLPDEGRIAAVAKRIGWSDPGDPATLAKTWVAELDRHKVSRAALIASVPGDEVSVGEAVRLYPKRFVGFFMIDPCARDADAALERAFTTLGLRCVCLFPAMHRYSLTDERVVKIFEAAAAHTKAVFVHCGALTVGVRSKLGLSSPFDWRLGDPLGVAALAARFPTVPVIIPHFGAGFFREVLMALDQCRNIHVDTSSSNAWMKYYPGLTLDGVFRQTLAVAGPQRLLFGTDSSFFPRGWQQAIYEAQLETLDTLGVREGEKQLILGGNFERIFA